MIGWAIVGSLLAALWALDALRLRRHAKALRVLPPSDEPESPEHVFLVRPGVELDDATRRAASAYARREALEVLDLVPPDLATWRALVLAATVDPATYRADRVAAGTTACDAILVHESVLARSGAARAPSDAVAMNEAIRVLKRYAVTQTDIAVAPGLRSPGVSLRERRRLLRLRHSDLVVPVVALQLALLGLAIAYAPPFGLAALLALHAQIFLVTVGTPLAPRDRLASLLARTLVDSASTFGFAAPEPAAGPSNEELRPAYDALLADGTARFFEPRREDCPMCGERKLSKAFELGDRYQFKPGRFALSRCDACRHVFQNPRLSIEGLDFYYRDFYDGLGGEFIETMFAAGPDTYRARARMVADVAKPERWLDVGAGHGHFCCVAREILPDTHFDGLDLSESIDDAVKRRWIDRGIRGLFPEVAPDLAQAAERYDVVSMSHYLEHTLDPRAEIAAAARILPKDGLLFIEVPDPDCRLGRLMGSSWMPWFQPQHLHFVSAKNLERLLRENAFEPIAWHRGEAHQAVDFTFLVYTALERMAPPADLPWRPKRGVGARAWRRVVRWTGVPALAAGWALDRVLGPLMRREGWSNTYRVLARRAA
jgi:ubiquinone/menaquinone biosynthesis C-methylase UbiE